MAPPVIKNDFIHLPIWIFPANTRSVNERKHISDVHLIEPQNSLNNKICNFFQVELTRCNLYFGSNFFKLSMLSYIKAKPVVLPPPKRVLNPKQTTQSEVDLYIRANFSRISVLATVALPGCKTSTII